MVPSTMTTPHCPICHNHYNSARVPYILQPCSHGICNDCAITYFDDRMETSCPVCRTTVLRRAVNYDLKEMCSGSLGGWKALLMDSLSKKPGINVTITDDLLPAAPLIMHRVTNNRDIHDSLVTLVRHFGAEEAYSWVDALQFPPDWDTDRKLSRMLRHYDFLSKYGADWVLEFT